MARAARFLLLVPAVTLLLFLSAGLGGAQGTKSQPEEYLLGGHPALSVRQTEQVYGPFAAAISRVLDRRVRFRTASSFEKYAAQLDSGVYDLVIAQAFDYIRIADRLGYRAVLRLGGAAGSVLIVSPESPVRAVTDLRGRRIVMPPAGSVATKSAVISLGRAGLLEPRDYQSYHVPGHIACVRHLLAARADACATTSVVLAAYASLTGATLEYRIVSFSSLVPQLAFAAHPRVPLEDVEKIAGALLPEAEDGGVRSMLAAAGLDSIVLATDADYDVARELEAELAQMAR